MDRGPNLAFLVTFATRAVLRAGAGRMMMVLMVLMGLIALISKFRNFKNHQAMICHDCIFVRSSDSEHSKLRDACHCCDHFLTSRHGPGSGLNLRPLTGPRFSWAEESFPSGPSTVEGVASTISISCSPKFEASRS